LVADEEAEVPVVVAEAPLDTIVEPVIIAWLPMVEVVEQEDDLGMG
jgi:hypothetical protein